MGISFAWTSSQDIVDMTPTACTYARFEEYFRLYICMYTYEHILCTSCHWNLTSEVNSSFSSLFPSLQNYKELESSVIFLSVKGRGRLEQQWPVNLFSRSVRKMNCNAVRVGPFRFEWKGERTDQIFLFYLQFLGLHTVNGLWVLVPSIVFSFCFVVEIKVKFL